MISLLSCKYMVQTSHILTMNTNTYTDRESYGVCHFEFLTCFKIRGFPIVVVS